MKFSTAFIVALLDVGGPAAAGPSRRRQADPVLSFSATRTGVISTLTPSPTSTVTATSTTTAGNGIQTPSPVQPSIVSNCAQFHLVVSGDRCSTISAKYGIPVDRFLEWNPAALSSCKDLKTNACVSVIGWSPSPTNPNNGIQTPLPAQPDVVSNCNQFHLVVPGDRCSTISAKFGIPVDAFLKWNPGALSSCKGLKTNAYALRLDHWVSAVGGQPRHQLPDARPDPAGSRQQLQQLSPRRRRRAVLDHRGQVQHSRGQVSPVEPESRQQLRGPPAKRLRLRVDVGPHADPTRQRHRHAVAGAAQHGRQRRRVRHDRAL
ncbi:LysM domain-containing protein like [Verticillium longisporum]|nr:LysM domain-containing protein like [Verticillium longisporum]